MVIEKVLGNLSDMETEGLVIDKVLLDHVDMAKPHQRLKTEHGLTLAVSLPHGERLFCGAVLLKDKEKIVVIDLLPEDVLVIFPEGKTGWGRVAYNIGNMHQPAYLGEDHICVPYDKVLEGILRDNAVSYERRNQKLDGVRANFAVRHQHKHDHKHDHG